MTNPHIQQAIECIESGRIEEGRFMLETLVPDFLDDQDRTDWACWLSRALVMGDATDTEGALEVLSEAIKRNPRDVRLHITKGIVLSEAQRMDEANKAFASAVVLDGNNWEAHLNRGIFREQIGKLSQAMNSYRVAAKLAGAQSGEAYCRLAWLHKRLMQWPDAIEAFENYLKIETGDAHEWVSLAILYSDMELFDKSLEAYQRALDVEPQNVSALFNLVITYQRMGHLENMTKAVKTLATTIEYDRRVAWAEGILLAEKGQLAEAKRRFRRVYLSALRDETAGVGEIGALAAWSFPILKELGAVEEAQFLLKQAFQAFIFDEDLLEAFVSNFGVVRRGARRFFLTVDASDPDPMPDENGIPRHWRYIRRYEIIATTKDEAFEQAFMAESVIGGLDLRRGRATKEEEFPNEVRTGIIYMSEGNAYIENEY